MRADLGNVGEDAVAESGGSVAGCLGSDARKGDSEDKDEYCSEGQHFRAYRGLRVCRDIVKVKRD